MGHEPFCVGGSVPSAAQTSVAPALRFFVCLGALLLNLVSPESARVSGSSAFARQLGSAGSSVTSPLPFIELLKTPGIEFVSYSPTNFNPNRLASGQLALIPSPASITDDLTTLRPAFSGLILYGSQTDDIGSGKQLVPWIVSEAKRLQFKAVVLGVWNPKDGAEVDAAAALARNYGADPNTFAIAVCLGNEGILRGEYGISDLDNAKARFEAQLGGLVLPIVTSEDLARYTIVPQLKSWGSFLFPIIVPHWNVPALGPADAAAWVRGQGASLRDQSQMTVLVKEAGFPSGGAPQYTPEAQHQFFAAYQAGARTADSASVPGTFVAYSAVLEAYDQFWKAFPDFTSWGLLTAARTPKPAFSDFTGRPTMSVDYPSSNAAIAPSFTVSGWAADLEALNGSGVDAVHVWAFPFLNGGFGAPTFVGIGSVGAARPDVGAVFGSQFTNSGFNVSASLPAGSYRLVVYAHSAITGTFNNSQFRDVMVQAPVSTPLMSLDSPVSNSTIQQPVNAGGWALDLGSSTGPGIDAVHVWAFPVIDGGVGGGIFVASAALGGARFDLGAVFGAQFVTAGFNFQVVGLAPGQYYLCTYAHSTVSGTFNQQRCPLVTVVH